LNNYSSKLNEYDVFSGSPAGDEDRTRKNVLGLSKLHKSTQGTLSCGLFYIGGSKIKVSRNYEYIKHEYEHKRGKIKGFSKASRRRMMYKMAEIDRNVKPEFATLTFPDEYYEFLDDDEQYKKIWKRFENRFRRKYPEAAAYWKKEYKPRKTGKYINVKFPHIHLLIYGIDHDEIQKWLMKTWWECCGKLSIEHLMAGTSCETVRSTRGVSYYVSKYMAKIDENTGPTGRMWGIIQPENIPWVKGILVQLNENEAIRLIRYMKRYARLKSRDYKSLIIFCNPDFWWDRLQDILYPT
jgi:hypothetical protein